jgi:hypothetical protein
MKRVLRGFILIVNIWFFSFIFDIALHRASLEWTLFPILGTMTIISALIVILKE